MEAHRSHSVVFSSAPAFATLVRTCPGVDCCDSPSGCASCCFNAPPHPMQPCQNPYGVNHTVQAYVASEREREGKQKERCGETW